MNIEQTKVNFKRTIPNSLVNRLIYQKARATRKIIIKYKIIYCIIILLHNTFDQSLYYYVVKLENVFFFFHFSRIFNYSKCFIPFRTGYNG